MKVGLYFWNEAIMGARRASSVGDSDIVDKMVN